MGHATAAAIKTLTGTHLLPLAGEQGPRLDDVPGDRAVVIKAAAPAQLDGGVTDVSHHHAPRGAWRSWDDGEADRHVTKMKDLEAYCSLFCESHELKSGLSFLEARKPHLQFWPPEKFISLSHLLQRLDGEVVAREERADPLQGPCHYFGLVRSGGLYDREITSDSQRG